MRLAYDGWARAFSLGLLSVLCAWSVEAPCRAQVVTLPELERKALESHALAERRGARVRGADAEIRRSAATYYPQISARAETTGQPGRFLVDITDDQGNEFVVSGTREIDQSQAFKPQFRHGLDITASGRIYDFGRTKAAVEAGKRSRAAVLAELAAEEENVVHTVRAAYLSWLSAHEMLRVTEAAQRDAESRLARVASLIEEGVRPKAELASVQSDVLLTTLELSRARADLEDARLALEDAVGAPIAPSAEPDLKLLETNPLPNPAPAGSTAVERVLDSQRAAARGLERTYKKDRLPYFGAALSAGVRVQNERVFPLYSGGIYLAMPLWDGGLTQAAVASAEAQADQLDAELRAETAQQEQLYRRAQREAEHALEALSIAQQLAELAEKRLADAQQGYELGVHGIEVVADARALSRRAQTEVLLSKVAHARARLRVTPVRE